MSRNRNPIPKLGETQSNPCGCAHKNPWEVRTPSGLEGVYADEGDANEEADHLRKTGVRGVEVERREKGTRPRARRFPAIQNPSARYPEEWQVGRSVSNMADNIGFIGVQGASNLLRGVGVDVVNYGYGYLRRIDNEHTVTVELIDGSIGQYPADRVWPVSGRYPKRNPAGDQRLFVGIYPTGIVYADKQRERDGDYLKVAFLPYSSLRLQWSPGNHPAELRHAIEEDAAAVIAQRGQPFQVSSSGQTVILGGDQRRRASSPPQYHERQGRPPGVPNPGKRNR